MSIRAMNWAWGQRVESTTDKLVLMALADRADDFGRHCFERQSVIAEKCCISRKTVIRAIKRLEAAGFLTKEERRRPDGGRSSNDYFLAIPPRDKGSHGCDTEGTGAGTVVSQQETPLDPSGKDTSLRSVSRARGISQEFEEFWSQVPKKVARGKARRAYANARRKADHQTIMAGIHRYAAEAASMDARFVAHPATWLNGERWTDQPVNGRTAAPGQPGSIAAAVSRFVHAREGQEGSRGRGDFMKALERAVQVRGGQSEEMRE